jgi:hypothetical protein
MKRILKIGLALWVVYLIPAGILNAQEKKNEQHIKIVVADKSGVKVEIDTLINGHISTGSIKLKNGEVIVLAKNGGAGTVKHIGDENGNIFVTVVSDDKGKKGEKNMTKKITVISGDSVNIQPISEEGDVIILKEGKHITGAGKGGKVVAWSSSSSSSSSSSVEKTKYVIAKDGMVVSIEGNDEAKVKELVKDVESKLGVSGDDKEVKKVVKEETKKTTKK